MRAKVAISSNTMWSIVNFRGRLIHALAERGHEVIVLAPMDKHASRLAHLNCRMIDLPIDGHGTNPLREMALFLRYLRILARERPGVYLGFTVKPNVYGSLAAHLLGIPVVNNITGLGRAFIRKSFMTRVVQWLYRLALRRSQRVFFQNEDDRQLFLALGLVQAQVADLLPGSGVDLAHFAPPSPARTAASAALLSAKEEARFCFLLLGRLLRDKGVEEYAQAARVVRRRFPAARFRLLGHIDEANPNAIARERVAQWESEGVVEYLGDTSDVRPVIAQADCVVLPSSYREGVPRSLLEAAAMARPVLTTDSVGCRDVVTEGVNGLLCQAGDAEDLAEKMMQMLRLNPEQRRRMGAAGRRKMEASFDDRIVIARTIDAIDHCLGVQGSAPLAQGHRAEAGPELEAQIRRRK